MLKRQRQLQYYLVRLRSEAELIPVLRSRIAALKGRIHASHDSLLASDRRQSHLANELGWMKVAEQRATIKNLQLHALTEHCKTQNAGTDVKKIDQVQILKAAFDEACDE